MFCCILRVPTPQPPAVCRVCGAPIRFRRTYCASCAVTVSKEALVKAARLGRGVAQSREARARHAETQRRHAAALKAWDPSDKPEWLDEKAYGEKIQPRLARITIPVISLALGVSNPYGARRGWSLTLLAKSKGRDAGGLGTTRHTSCESCTFRRVFCPGSAEMGQLGKGTEAIV